MIKRVLTKEDVIKIEGLFTNVNTLGTQYFLDPKEIVFFHSAPFVDEDSYSLFSALVNASKSEYVDIVGMPLIIGSEYLRFYGLPASFKEFNGAVTDASFVYTGGLGFTEGREIQFVSCADTEIVILNLPHHIRLDQYAHLSFSSVINESKAESIVAEHLAFLKSVTNK